MMGRKARRIRDLEAERSRLRDLVESMDRRLVLEKERRRNWHSGFIRLETENAGLRETLDKAEAQYAALKGKWDKLKRGLGELGKV